MNDTTAEIFKSNYEDDSMPLIKSVYLAMMMFIGAELMLFSGFIGAFILLKLSSVSWPPPQINRRFLFLSRV